jgi:hypothetical protein
MSYRRTNGVTRWFHTLDVCETSPAMSVMDFNDAFLDLCKTYGFSLRVTEQQFRKRMCEFVCTLYLAKRYGDSVTGPHTLPFPCDWTREMHERWLDYIQQFYFSANDWQQFWKGIPVSPWEEALPTWRSDIQAVAILYILGDTERLLQAGTLYKDEMVSEEHEHTAAMGGGSHE